VYTGLLDSELLVHSRLSSKLVYTMNILMKLC